MQVVLFYRRQTTLPRPPALCAELPAYYAAYARYVCMSGGLFTQGVYRTPLGPSALQDDTR